MGFEIPFRLYISDVVLNNYSSYSNFENALIVHKNQLSPSDSIFLRTNLPSVCTSNKCQKLYNNLLNANSNRFSSIIPTDKEVPVVGELNILTFTFKNIFTDLYILFGGYHDYCVLAEKYRYARNKLDHPGCKTLEDTDLVPIISFVKDIINFLDISYFPQKSKDALLVEVSALQNRKIEIPVHKHNIQDMPYTESRIVCRENEIELLKKFICGNPNDLRKQHSCCIYGYGGVGKTALVLEVVKRTIQDIREDNALNDYKPEYILFFSAKKRKLEIGAANGKIVEQTIHKFFKNSTELSQLIFDALELSTFKDYHKEGIIIVDNLESLESDERKKIKCFIESQTPSEMQFLITSRNSEEYEMNYKLSGFEHDAGINFVKQYIIENSLDLELNSEEIEELLSLSKGNTLVLVLCLRRLSQKLASISGLHSEFSSINAWKSIRNSLKNIPGNAYEVISEFMFKDTFEEIEKRFSADCELFYKILKIFAVYPSNNVDLNTICILAKESYPRVEAVADILCNYLILEKNRESYGLNNFAEKYIINRFMPDATTYNTLSSQIWQREMQVQRELNELNNDIKNRSELAKIMRDWCVVSDSDRITAANMYRLYGEASQACRNDSRLKTEAILENVISSSKDAEEITAHPYIKFQKARILLLIDRSKILPETHSKEIIEGFRTAIFVIKTIDQFSPIQNTKSYASLLWIFGQYLADIGQIEEAIRYLEESATSFLSMDIKDKEYYQCLSKLGAAYLDYYEKDPIEHQKYLSLARETSTKLPNSFARSRSGKDFAKVLKSRLERYRYIR